MVDDNKLLSIEVELGGNFKLWLSTELIGGKVDDLVDEKDDEMDDEIDESNEGFARRVVMK